MCRDGRYPDACGAYGQLPRLAGSRSMASQVRVHSTGTFRPREAVHVQSTLQHETQRLRSVHRKPIVSVADTDSHVLRISKVLISRDLKVRK